VVRFLTSLVLMAGISVAQADGSAGNEVVAKVEQVYQEVNSLQASFEQVTRSVTMGEVRQTGTVQLQRPGQMRWEFEGERLFVSDGQQMWVWSAADNQVIVTSELAGSGGSLTGLLDNLNQLTALFDVQSTAEPAGDVHVLQLTPKEETSFKSLRLEMETETLALKKAVMVDLFDNEVEILFSNMVFNPNYSAGHFVFDIPDGAEVLRTEGM